MPRSEHYVRCGADILLNGMQDDLEGEGQCPICGGTIHLRVKGQRIHGLEPENSILHAVELPMEQGTFNIECEGSHLFDKEDCLNAWLKNYKGRRGSILSPQEFLDRVIRLKSLRGPN
jgi:hypothetical protein